MITPARQNSGNLLHQLLKFGVAGIGVAVFSVAVYWVAAVPLAIHPLVANFLSYVANVALGFVVHRAWTFKEAAQSGRQSSAIVKYFCVSLVALAINTVWTFVLTDQLLLAAWTPIVPMVFFTPIVTFFINRHWVFY